jgi:hypothetical protein
MISIISFMYLQIVTISVIFSAYHWLIIMKWDYISELLPLVDILFISHVIWVWRAMVEWYIIGKTRELREKPVPVPLCPPQIPHGLIWTWTWASTVRGRQLTFWAMARLLHSVKQISGMTWPVITAYWSSILLLCFIFWTEL